MGEDKTEIKKLEAPKLEPLNLSCRLAPAPTGSPKYSVTIKDAYGKKVILADPRATRALVALMDMHAVLGGAACHWGGPAAMAEMMSAIHGIMFSVKDRPWFEAYNFVNDAGHAENGVYALRANYGYAGLTFEDLKGFRSLQSKLTGHGESHVNPECVLLSNGPLGSSLPQAQGLAIADKVAGRDRVTICVVSDGAAMEGEAKEAFAAIPGLAAKDKLNPFVIVLSDNDTKLSGRISKDAFSMQPTFEAMSVLGWKVIKVNNGHDLRSVYLAIERAINNARNNPQKPVCVWIKTIKGYGVKETEQSASGGHGFPLSNAEKIVDFVSEIYGGNPPEEFLQWASSLKAEWQKKEEQKRSQQSASQPASSNIKKDKIQAGIAAAVVKAAQAGYPVFSISSDVQGSTGMSVFHKSFPDRFIDVGVAEANMISTAAGFAKAGFIPVVDTFAQFGVTKGNLPLTMAALSQAPVIAVFSHVGLQDAADGASHQATTYLAAVSAIPHTVVVCPSCAEEAEALMYKAVERLAEARKRGEDGESVVFFIGRESYPVRWLNNQSYEWLKAQVLTEGKDVTIVTCGSLVGEAIKAAEVLKTKGVSATVINNPFVNRVDVATIASSLKETGGKLVTIEDHQYLCGMGAMLAHALATAGVQMRMISLGIKGEFGRSAYTAAQLYQYYHLSSQDIIDAVHQLLK